MVKQTSGGVKPTQRKSMNEAPQAKGRERGGMTDKGVVGRDDLVSTGMLGLLAFVERI